MRIEMRKCIHHRNFDLIYPQATATATTFFFFLAMNEYEVNSSQSHSEGFSDGVG